MPETRQQPPKQARTSTNPTPNHEASTPTTRPTQVTLVTDFGRLQGKKRLMAQSLVATHGVVTHAARLAQMSVRNHYRWLKEDPYYAEITENARLARLYAALAIVLERMASAGPDSLQAAKYVLDNEGQAIGYGLKPQAAVQVNTAVALPPGMVNVLELKKFLQKEAEEQATGGEKR